MSYHYEAWLPERGQLGRPLAADGSTWKPGKERGCRERVRVLGDSMCEQCPKYNEGNVIEPTVQQWEDVRVAVVCMRLGCTPSELLKQPYGVMRVIMPLLEDPFIVRLARGQTNG